MLFIFLQKYHFLAYATRVYHKNTNVPQGVFADFQRVMFLAVAKNTNAVQVDA